MPFIVPERENKVGEKPALLDQLSISQTRPLFCPYGAPLIAMIFRGNATIQQACCNHWDCPVCGETRARQEYRRIVYGAECLNDDGHKLYFWTLTCRGKEMPLAEAQENYLAWTNVLLTNARSRAKRKGLYWSYVQVTERQQRGHPHSHILTTYLPIDALQYVHGDDAPSYTSEWFTAANESAGLGSQHRISAVENTSAVSRYIAKYLFKDSMLTHWPAHWRRVRYSQNWPTPPYQAAEWVTQLLKPSDWSMVAKRSETFICGTDATYEVAYKRLANIRKRVSDIDF
jgi:hypothetical protein